MTNAHHTKRINRIRRHKRIRAKISGTVQRPRVTVFRSLQHIVAQAIDDVSHRTISVSDDRAITKGTKTERALIVGKGLGALLKEKKITTVVFDVSGYAYHGRVRAVAEGLRESGIQV